MRWEVKTIHGPTDASHAADQVPLGVQLAELLDQGWEPFGVLDRGPETWVFLKRRAFTGEAFDLRTSVITIPTLETPDSRRREKEVLQARRKQFRDERRKAKKGQKP